MAYVLGFFAADGSMLRNNRGAHFIEFHITDKEVVEAIRKCLKSNHKITEKQRNPKHKPIYRLQIGSKNMFEDLEKLGFCQAKSKILYFPQVPKMFMSDFVRGYFDGDGGVYFKQYQPKDRKNPRWVFSSRFTSGSKIFLSSLHLYLKEAAGIKGGFVVEKTKHNGFDLVFSHRDSVALCNFMYNNSPRIYLKRKYDTFQRALNTLYGSQSRS